jgi:hypothetical protein
VLKIALIIALISDIIVWLLTLVKLVGSNVDSVRVTIVVLLVVMLMRPRRNLAVSWRHPTPHSTHRWVWMLVAMVPFVLTV